MHICRGHSGRKRTRPELLRRSPVKGSKPKLAVARKRQRFAVGVNRGCFDMFQNQLPGAPGRRDAPQAATGEVIDGFTVGRPDRGITILGRSGELRRLVRPSAAREDLLDSVNPGRISDGVSIRRPCRGALLSFSRRDSRELVLRQIRTGHRCKERRKNDSGGQACEGARRDQKEKQTSPPAPRVRGLRRLNPAGAL